MEKRRLELEGNYNFKFNDELNCYEFIYEGKKAFIINLALRGNIERIIPFFIHRGHLAQLVDYMFEIDPQDETLRIKTSQRFIGMSMEIFANMLDETKMGSIEGFINHIWEHTNEFKEFHEIMGIYSNLMTMIDISVEYQLRSMDKQKLDDLHSNFIKDSFANVAPPGARIFRLDKKTGMVEELTEPEDEPEQQYDLSKMTPINIKEI